MKRALRNWGGILGTIILNAKTGVVNFIKYLIQRRGKYSRRVSFIVLSLLLFIPFQNCSQGTFKIEETDSSSVSNNSVNEPSNTAETVGTPTNNPPGTIAPVAPTEPTAPTGPVGPSAAQIQAEIERKNRCKGWLQTPMIMNADVVKAKVFNLKAGLAVGSGDIDDASSLDVIVDDNKGVNPKVDPADGCTYETRLQVSLSMDAGKVSQFNSGIDASGAPITIDNDVNGQRVTDRLGAAVEPRANNNNLNNGGATYANSNISLRFRNRQANMGTRAIRCADGVAYYKLFIRVSTTNLNTVKVGYASTNMANVSLESEPIYVQTNIENNCWKEQKLNNAIASEDSTKLPATNAKFGTSVAMDGDFAAALSEGEDDLGYIYLFKKNLKGNWSFVQKILPGNPIGSNLTSVALKGNLLAVSSMGNQGFSGRVYVYSISSGLASLVQTIKNPVTCSYPTTPCSRFGSSLALTGSSVIVGDVTAQVKGAVYLYAYNAELFGDGSTSDRTPTSTLLGTILSSNDAFNDLQALGANLVFQGGRAVVAAYQGANSYKGSIHIFNVDAGTFVNVASINSPSIISDKGKFGSSISFDGTSLAVGAVDDSRPGQIARGAMIYYQNYTDVTNPFIIFGAGADEIRFGVSLAMVGDSVYVGTRGNSSSGGSISRHTKANLNARNASVSFLQLDHYSENGESFSYSMSVSEGASKPTIIVGAQTKPQVVSPSEIRSNAGAVYIYEIK